MNETIKKKKNKWKVLSCCLHFDKRGSWATSITWTMILNYVCVTTCTLILYYLQQQNCVFITSHIQNMFLRRWRICEKFLIQTTDAIKILIWNNHLNFKVVYRTPLYFDVLTTEINNYIINYNLIIFAFSIFCHLPT